MAERTGALVNVFDDSPHSGDYFVSTDKRLISQQWMVANLLSQPWTDCWSHERLWEAVQNSLCFGVYQRQEHVQGEAPIHPRMVGFARVLTDEATYSIICDVVIELTHRKKGLGKFLMATILGHYQVKNTVCVLRTNNAEAASLYRKFGFSEVPAMRRIPDAYNQK